MPPPPPPPVKSVASTRKSLLREAGEDEFDVTFEDMALGLRLEEKAVYSEGEGLKYVSMVVSVTDGGWADREGVEEGCVIVGVNGEKFLSHAHTVATLKHGRRPVTVRFQLPPEDEEYQDG